MYIYVSLLVIVSVTQSIQEHSDRMVVMATLTYYTFVASLKA